MNRRRGSGGEGRAGDEFDRRGDRAEDLESQTDRAGVAALQVQREQGDEQRHGSQEGVPGKAESVHRERGRCRYVRLVISRYKSFRFHRSVHGTRMAMWCDPCIAHGYVALSLMTEGQPRLAFSVIYIKR